MADSHQQLEILQTKLMETDSSRLLRFVYIFSILVGFIIRLTISVRNWGMLHPDEIYQSLEIAHYIVYGTGYIAPEFRASNLSIPSYAASRSWLFPMIFAMFMYLGEFLHLNYFTQTLIMIKIFMAIVSTLLIPAVYKLTYQTSKDQTTATLAAFFVAFWFRIIEYTVRTFTNTFFLPFIFYGIYRVLKHSEEDNFTLQAYIEIGFYLGISTYIRVDMGILVFSFFIVYFKKSKILNYLAIGIVSFLFWCWGALYDYNMYKTAPFFSVIINWFTFNIIEGHSKIFGVSNPLFYIGVLLVVDFLLLYVLLLIMWPIIDRLKSREFSVFSSEIGKSFKKVTFATLITWIIYSNFWITFENGHFVVPESHKETRFMIGGLVMFLMVVAYLHRMLLSELPNILSKRQRKEYDSFKIDTKLLKKYRRILFGLMLILFLLTTLTATIVRKPTDNWAGINRCLTYIGSTDPNATDIYIAEVWFVTGYYTYSNVSAKTNFHFYDVTDENTRQSSVYLLSRAIRQAENSSYLILPWFVSEYYPQLYHDLALYNWTNIYTNDNTYLWTPRE